MSRYKNKQGGLTMNALEMKSKELGKSFEGLPNPKAVTSPFPACGCEHNCEIMPILGASECESVCPWKFDQNGDPLSENELKALRR